MRTFDRRGAWGSRYDCIAVPIEARDRLSTADRGARFAVERLRWSGADLRTLQRALGSTRPWRSPDTTPSCPGRVFESAEFAWRSMARGRLEEVPAGRRVVIQSCDRRRDASPLHAEAVRDDRFLAVRDRAQGAPEWKDICPVGVGEKRLSTRQAETCARDGAFRRQQAIVCPLPGAAQASGA